MDAFSMTSRHPVLHYLAVARAARDFGVDAADLDALTRRFRPAAGAVERLAEAATAVLLDEFPAVAGSYGKRLDPGGADDVRTDRAVRQPFQRPGGGGDAVA